MNWYKRIKNCLYGEDDDDDNKKNSQGAHTKNHSNVIDIRRNLQQRHIAETLLTIIDTQIAFYIESFPILQSEVFQKTEEPYLYEILKLYFLIMTTIHFVSLRRISYV